ncbi:NACHT nucleoside triphosphatase [Penicillium angulare]|uniref:NACHT nucleoside triphosphatase n=1 Tax=Penicillium angulare TaxID=116970 RepID=UPI00254114EB|nr:NACHT nucleoside triphosphatase [Penicillium angulare]KAJ5266574.1 NACHT nucleoside triphosphatase [Penicillium angulare]
MAALFHHSRDLQLAVSEYFIVVVRVCSDMLQFTKMSSLKRVASYVSDKILIEYQMELQSWGEVIRDELQIERAKKRQQEEAANSKSRNILGELFQSSSNQEKFQAKQQILDFCSQFEYMTTWKQSRRMGNTKLFRDCESYKAWKSDQSCSTLVYTGKLGVGKSVMCANMVDDLQMPLDGEKRVVAFFFIRDDTAETLTARAIIGSVTQQLLSQIVDPKTDSDVFKAICELFQTTASIDDYQRMKKLLSLVLIPQRKAFVIIDGIDELSSFQMGVFFDQFGDLQKGLGISVCISTRQDSSDAIKSSRNALHNRVVAKVPDNATEIENYISEEINRRLRSEELIIGDRKLISEISNALYRGSQDQEIRNSLDDLPQDLSETYARILKKSNKPGRSYQRIILHMVLVAQRQMIIEELQVLLSVSPGDINWNSSQLINSIYSTLKCCGGLVTVDEEELTVHFVHHSFKQYLTESPELGEHYWISVHGAHRQMAYTIITYLSYSLFEQQISSQKVPIVHARPAVSEIIQSTRSQAGWIGDIAANLLQRKEKHALRMNIGKTLAEVRPAAPTSNQAVLAFSDYASTFWAIHLAESLPLPPNISPLLQRLCNRNFFSAEKSQKIHILFGKAAEFNHVLLIQYAVEAMGVDVNCAVNSTGSTALHVACAFGHYETVQCLTYMDGTNLMALDSYGKTPVRIACDEINFQLLEFFFDAGILSQSSELMELTLRLACTSGHGIINKIFKALHSDQLMFNLNASGDDSKTALHLAIENGHDNIAKALLSLPGVDASQSDVYGHTPLILAMRVENDALFGMLMNLPEVDINKPDPRDERTPLQKAIILKSETIIAHILHNTRSRFLITDYGQFVDCLSWIIDGQRDSLFKVLLNHPDVKSNLRVFYPITINFVMKYGYVAFLEILLSHFSIEHAFQSPFDNTSLEQAISHGDNTMLRIFFDHPSINLYISEYLHSAVKLGRMDIMKMLMAYSKIDINLADKNGCTPLYHAVRCGNMGMVEMLLDRRDIANTFNLRLEHSPLWIAITSHYTRMVKKLLKHYVMDDTEMRNAAGPTLKFGIEFGDQSVVAVILAHFGTRIVQLNARYKFLQVALSNCQLAIAKLLLTDVPRSAIVRDNRGRSALHWAIQAPWNEKSDRVTIIRSIMELFPVLLTARDDENNTSLHFAAQMNLDDVLKLLLPSTRELINHKNIKGQIPLHLAAGSDGGESVLTLLAYAANADIPDKSGLNAQDTALRTQNKEAWHLLDSYSASLKPEDTSKGRLTPLHCAATLGDLFIGRILLKEYPHLLNYQEQDGMTALHISVLQKRTDFALMLLHTESVIFNETDSFNNTPLSYAEKDGNKQIQDVILHKLSA